MRHTEEYLQTGCVRWFDYQYSAYRLLLHHSPNGGRRNAREAGRFKAMGTRAGFPDLVLFHPDFATRQIAPLFIEFKSDTGRQSESQKDYQQLLTAKGYKYIICRSFDDFKANIEAYLTQ